MSENKKGSYFLEGRTSISSKWFPNVYLDTNRAKQIKQNSNFWQYPRFAREIFTQQKYTGKLLSTSNIILH